MYKYHVSLYLDNSKTHECGITSSILEVSDPINTEDAIDKLEEWCLENYKAAPPKELGFIPDDVMVLGLTQLEVSDEQAEEPKKRKTYAEDFLEKFPNHVGSKDTMLTYNCVDMFYGVNTEHCDSISCEFCWDREMEE